MATNYFLGVAPLVKQVVTGAVFTVDATPANNTFILTITGPGGSSSVSIVGVTSVAATAAALVAAATAAGVAGNPWWSNIVWTNPSAGNVVATAATAGCPFTATPAGAISNITITKTGGGNGAVTAFALTTANSGPQDWGVAANWSLGAVPVNTDDVVISDSAVNILWNMDQSAVTLNSLRITKSFTGYLGLNRTVFTTSADASTTVSTNVEYRQQYLKVLVSTNVYIGENFSPISLNGSQRIMLDLGATACTITVFDTASAASEQGRPSVRILTNSATTDLFVRQGSGGVGVGMDKPNETASIRKIVCSDTSAATKVSCGAGVTVVTWSQDGGTNFLQCANTPTTVTVNGGTLTVEGNSTYTTTTVNGGTLVFNGGTITTLNANAGTLDCGQSDTAKTWTNSNINVGVTFINNQPYLTFTNPPVFASGKRYSMSVSAA